MSGSRKRINAHTIRSLMTCWPIVLRVRERVWLGVLGSWRISESHRDGSLINWLLIPLIDCSRGRFDIVEVNETTSTALLSAAISKNLFHKENRYKLNYTSNQEILPTLTLEMVPHSANMLERSFSENANGIPET